MGAPGRWICVCVHVKNACVEGMVSGAHAAMYCGHSIAVTQAQTATEA